MSEKERLLYAKIRYREFLEMMLSECVPSAYRYPGKEYRTQAAINLREVTAEIRQMQEKG